MKKNLILCLFTVLALIITINSVFAYPTSDWFGPYSGVKYRFLRVSHTKYYDNIQWQNDNNRAVSINYVIEFVNSYGNTQRNPRTIARLNSGAMSDRESIPIKAEVMNIKVKNPSY